MRNQPAIKYRIVDKMLLFCMGLKYTTIVIKSSQYVDNLKTT